MLRQVTEVTEVERAAKLVKEHDLILGLCFVIGLPGDNLERHKDSLREARMHGLIGAFCAYLAPWL